MTVPFYDQALWKHDFKEGFVVISDWLCLEMNCAACFFFFYTGLSVQHAVEK